MKLKVVLAVVALGRGFMARQQWETAETERVLKTRCVLCLSSLTSKSLTIVMHHVFEEKHASMARFIRLLVELPGGKWKIVSEKEKEIPRTALHLRKVADVTRLVLEAQIMADGSINAGFLQAR